MSEIKQVLDKIDKLSDSINELVTQIAKKEIHDQYRDERLAKLEESVTRLHQRVDDLEKIEASNESINKIKIWFWRSVIGTLGGGAAVGIIFLIKLYANSKGG